MSRHGAIEQDFGDGTYTFRLGLDEIEELERKRDLSIFQIVMRLSPEQREARLSDLSEVLRLGLIGGGMKPVEAMALVRRYVDQRPLDESRDIAYAVGLAALMRLHSTEIEEPPAGEAEAAGPNASTSPQSEAVRG
jgi:hypothetical protein